MQTVGTIVSEPLFRRARLIMASVDKRDISAFLWSSQLRQSCQRWRGETGSRGSPWFVLCHSDRLFSPLNTVALRLQEESSKVGSRKHGGSLWIAWLPVSFIIVSCILRLSLLAFAFGLIIIHPINPAFHFTESSAFARRLLTQRPSSYTTVYL